MTNGAPNPKHQIWANYSTIAASVVAIGTLIFGYLTYSSTTVSANNARAVDLLQKYYEFRFQHEHELQNCPEKSSDRCKSFGYLSVFVAESIYNLTDGKHSWGETVKGILCQQLYFIRTEPLPFAEYTAEFRDILEKMRRPEACGT
jgi:hypothetical protein